MTHMVPAPVHPRRSRARAAPLVLAATLALAATLLVPTTGRARGAALARDGMLPAPCAPGASVRWVTSSLATIVPPPSFEPATASDAALACYGVPPRPRDAAGRARWAADTRRWRYIIPVLGQPRRDRRIRQVRPALAPQARAQGQGVLQREGDARRPQQRPHANGPHGLYNYDVNNCLWAGYVVLSVDNGVYYTQAEADFTVPTTTPGGYGAGPSTVATWVGLGGVSGKDDQGQSLGASNIIWQAGISTFDPAYAFWFENYCGPPTDLRTCYRGGAPQYPLTTPDVTAGQRVRITVDAQHGTYYFYNYSTGGATNVTAIPINNNTTGDSAEFVEEEALCDTICAYVSVSDARFANAVAVGNSSARGLAGWTYRHVHLINRLTSFQLDNLGDVNPSTNGFSVSVDASNPGIGLGPYKCS